MTATAQESAVVRRPRGGPSIGWSTLTGKWPLRLLSLAIVMTFWQFFGRKYPYSISDPRSIFDAGRETWRSELLPAFGQTSGSFFLGFAICIVVGVPVGLLMARSRLVELSLAPYVSALYATPRLALIPVMMLWFGFTFELRLMVVIVSGVFPIIMNTWLGAKEVDRDLLDAGTAFAASKLQSLKTIVIPGSLHYTFAGMRIGLARALVGTVVAEIITSIAGVGHLLEHSAQTLQIAQMWLAIITLGFFALGCSSILKFAERWTTMPWTRGLRGSRWTKWRNARLGPPWLSRP
jgi:ABC-type nitrate/sulfonate/bicarbonate transport system permease component